ncbi:MAG TPA: VOC family protein [Acidimicrobiales bacterium]|nr:VOC family protein [Acidimicrobiales bacterium]
MALEHVRLHHHGVRIDPDRADESIAFYRDVLGLEPDAARPSSPTFPGAWLDCDNDTQIHLLGARGTSPYALGPDEDPAVPHVALAVPDIGDARDELDRVGVSYFAMAAGPTEQLFVRDPSGNMIELHQSGTCRCERSSRS